MSITALRSLTNTRDFPGGFLVFLGGGKKTLKFPLDDGGISSGYINEKATTLHQGRWIKPYGSPSMPHGSMPYARGDGKFLSRICWRRKWLAGKERFFLSFFLNQTITKSRFHLTRYYTLVSSSCIPTQKKATCWSPVRPDAVDLIPIISFFPKTCVLLLYSEGSTEACISLWGPGLPLPMIADWKEKKRGCAHRIFLTDPITLKSRP